MLDDTLCNLAVRCQWCRVSGSCLETGSTCSEPSNAIFWINAEGGDWHSPANWDTGAVPTLTDEVHITLPGEYEVRVTSQTAMAKTVTLGWDCLSMDCHSRSRPSLIIRNHLTVNENFVALPKSYVRFEYTVPGNMQIVVNGALRNFAFMSVSSRVTFTGDGSITNNGVFKVERQTTSHANVFNVNFTNHGVLDFESTSSFVTINAVLQNQNSGVVVTNGQTMGDGTINNTGVIIMKNPGTRTISPRLLNFGHFLVQGGTVATTGVLENSGTIDIKGRLRCSALTVLNEPSSFINGDVLQLLSGTHVLQGGTFGVDLITVEPSSTLTVNGYVELQTLELFGGVVDITTDVFAVTILSLKYGTIRGNGKRIIANQIIFTPYSYKYIYNTTISVSELLTSQASAQTLHVYIYTDTVINMLEDSTVWIGSDQTLFLDQRDGSRCVLNVHSRMQISGVFQTDMVFTLDSAELRVVGTGRLDFSGPASFWASNIFISRHGTLWLDDGISTPTVSFSTGTHIHNDGHIRASTPVFVSLDSTVSLSFGQITCDVSGRFEITSSTSGLESIRQLIMRDSAEVLIRDEDGKNSPLYVESVTLYGGSLKLNTDVIVERLVYSGYANFYLNENYTYSIMKELRLSGSGDLLFECVGSGQAVLDVLGQFKIDDKPRLYIRAVVFRLHSFGYISQATNVYLQTNGVLEIMSRSNLLIIDSYIRVTTAGTLQNHGSMTFAGSDSHIYANFINDGTILVSRGELHIRSHSSNLGEVKVQKNAAMSFYSGQHVFIRGSLTCHQGNPHIHNAK